MTGMDNSELRKRILEVSTVPKGVHFTVTDTEELFKILEEAKADIFSNIPTSELPIIYGAESWETMAKEFFKNQQELKEKLIKWFVGSKTDKQIGDSNEQRQ